RTVVAHVIARLATLLPPERVVLAVPDQPVDDPPARVGREAGVSVVRGPEADVLERFRLALGKTPPPWTIRVNADSPFIDPAMLEDFLLRARAGKMDHVGIERWTAPPGFECEVVRTETLLLAARVATEPPDREHVTWFIRRQPERFRVKVVKWEAGAHRFDWTVLIDKPSDLARLERVHATLAPVSAAFGARHALAEIGPTWPFPEPRE
ncbi:MAG: hypothetical protein HY719_05035, partial [Planctomycetes bacterium]|nr:hypothetical protein [Planctomycetota bacterium]